MRDSFGHDERSRSLEAAYLIVGNDRSGAGAAPSRSCGGVSSPRAAATSTWCRSRWRSSRRPRPRRRLIEAAEISPGVRPRHTTSSGVGCRPVQRQRAQGAARLHPRPDARDDSRLGRPRKWPKDDVLYKTVFKAGGISVLTICSRKYEMAGWVRERAAAEAAADGRRRGRHSARRLWLLSAAQRTARTRDREARPASAAASRPTADDVDAVCTPDDEARIFDLMDAVGHRDRTKAFRLLETVFASGDPREDANRVLYGLLRYVRQLEAARQLGASDQGGGEVAWRAPLHGEEAAGAAQGLRPAPLRQGLPGAGGGGNRMRGRAPATLETASGVNDSDRLVVEAGPRATAL